MNLFFYEAVNFSPWIILESLMANDNIDTIYFWIVMIAVCHQK
jgi:hypothetical protein